jgi:hypothetical protein
MRKQVLALVVTGTLAAGAAWAQEPEREEAPPRPLHRIRVLENPYDISSFYRASGSRAYDFMGAEDRYPIASYFRGATRPDGYSRFFTSAQGPARRAVVPYRGRSGDLYLLAPALLAPVGPLSDAYFGDR